MSVNSSSGHCSCTKQLDISHLSFDGARETIDRRIRELHASIRYLQEQRNKLTSISRLPSELLILIFKHARSESDGTYYTGGTYGGGGARFAPQWKRFCAITQVCRQWRAITLAHSDFWSRIIFETPAIAEGMLQRSNKAPLYIRMSNNIFVQRQKQSLQSKFMDMFRLAELHLDLETSHLDSLLSAATGTTANLLQSIYIHRSRNYSPGSYTIPSIIFPSTPLPRLQHLDVTDCNLDWSTLHFGKHSFNSLISLKLKNAAPPSKKLFYSFLSHTPELETLVIDGSALPSSTDSVSQGVIQDVRLPKLRSCTLLNIALVSCVDFQQLVIYPATEAQLKFELSKEPISTHSHATPVDIASLIDRLLTSCGLSKDSSPKRAHRNILLRNSTYSFAGGRNGPGITLWDGPLTDARDDALHSNAKTNPQVEITFPSNIKLSSLSISGIEGLAIHYTVSSYSLDEWYAFFKNHSRISHMYIESSHIAPIATAISTPRTGYTLCLPNLGTVTLTGHCRRMIREESEDEFDNLIDCLIARSNYRMPLQTLHLIECCFMDEDNVELLDEIVVDVKWDGQYMGSEDGEDEGEMGSDDDDYCGFYHQPYDYDSFDEAMYYDY